MTTDIAGYVMVAGKWEPVNVLRPTQDGWAEWRYDGEGYTDTGVSRPGNWTFIEEYNA